MALIKACSQVKDLGRGSRIHAMIEKDGSLDMYPVVMTHVEKALYCYENMQF